MIRSDSVATEGPSLGTSCGFGAKKRCGFIALSPLQPSVVRLKSNLTIGRFSVTWLHEVVREKSRLAVNKKKRRRIYGVEVSTEYPALDEYARSMTSHVPITQAFEGSNYLNSERLT